MTEVYSKLITSENPKLMNYSSRGGHAIDRIVLHHNATTNKDTAMNTWLQSAPAQTSAHYEVTPTEIIGCVSESDAAWHCGGTGGADKPKMDYPNQRSIGIENVNSTGAPNWEVAHDTVINCARLVADICKRYGIPCDRTHVLGHREVTSTACPGGLNVDEVVNLANGYINGAATSAPSNQSAPSAPAKKSLSTIAEEVVAGKWGNDPERSNNLRAAGYDTNAVQNEVNKLLGAPSAPAAPDVVWHAESGTFVITSSDGIIMRSESPSVNSPVLAVLPYGSTVQYNAFCYKDGYVWIRQPRSGGQYGYLPTGNASGNHRTSYWGTFK